MAATAQQWADKAVSHYRIFYQVDRGRVTELAEMNPSRVLVLGVFAGWNPDGHSTLIYQAVILSEDFPPSIVTKQMVQPPKETAYVTDPLTQELIEGKTERAKTVANKWTKAKKTFPPIVRDWRWLEFMIKASSEYEESIGNSVDVLEITSAGPKWLQNPNCR